MAGIFSKERIEKRQRKMHKMGRLKFSLLYAFLFAISIKLIGLVVDIVFDGYIDLHRYFTLKELLGLIILLIFMFFLAYYLIWNQMEYDFKSKIKQDKK